MKKKKGKYDVTLAVKGDFIDILKATASAANKKTVKKKDRKKAK
jgi:hypothetical protein